MKFFIVSALCVLCGCTQPIKKQNLNASTLASNKAPVLIEINSVPQPFDVAGHNPYVLWINGMYISQPDHKALSDIINQIGKERIPDIDPRNIHDGWIQPRFVKQYFEEKKIKGRDRKVTQ